MAEQVTELQVQKDDAPATAPEEQRWAPFDTLRGEIDRLFDDFHPLSWRMPRRLPSLAQAGRPFAFPVAPAMDLVEKDGTYRITAELPGMDASDVEVKIADGMLTVRGEKKEEKEEKDGDRYLSERRYGAFQRTFRVPPSVETDKIEANFSKGVLTVTLPKSAEARESEKRIKVNAA